MVNFVKRLDLQIMYIEMITVQRNNEKKLLWSFSVFIDISAMALLSYVIITYIINGLVMYLICNVKFHHGAKINDVKYIKKLLWIYSCISQRENKLI